MELNKKRMSAYFKAALVFVGTLLALYLLAEIALYLLPFTIALLIALIIEPLVRLIIKLKVKRSIASFIALIFTLALVVTLLVFLLIRAYVTLMEFGTQLPDYLRSLSAAFDKWTLSFFADNPESADAVRQLGHTIFSSLSGLIAPIGKGVFSTAAAVPQALISTVITLLASYFIASSRKNIGPFIKRQFSSSVHDRVVSIKRDLFGALGAYVRTQLIMMSITFAELSLGFIIMGFNYGDNLPFILLMTLIDALPMFGAGLFLLPWMAYSFFMGNTTLGFSLLALYAILIVVRQLVEPRILSREIRIHPLLTLLSIFLGLQLFGVIGLLLGPIMLVVYKNIINFVMKGRTLHEMIQEWSDK